MNGLPLLFWLALALPGLALARRWFPREISGGALPALGFAWLASLACLAPIFAACYLAGDSARVSTGVLAGLVAIWIAWGAVDLAALLFLGRGGAVARDVGGQAPSIPTREEARRNAWRACTRALLPVLGIAGVIVVGDAYLADRHGAILDNDSRVHIARIRFLLDHGISNADPFVRTPIEYAYPIYHTNLLHALCAVSSKLLAIDPITVWFNSLAASRLLIASGIAYLAWAVLGGAWAPWIAAAMVVVNRSPYPFTIYPNQLAPWALMPLAIGVLIRVVGAPWRGERLSLARVLVLAALPAGVVGMFHPLYAGFLFVVGAPVAACAAVWHLRGSDMRRMAHAGHALAACAALSATALLFPMASVLMTPRVPDSSVPSEVARIDDGAVRGEEAAAADEIAEAQESAMGSVVRRRERPKPSIVRPQDGFTFYERGEDDWIARTWGRGFTGGFAGVKAWRVWMGIAGIALSIWLLRRRETALLAIAVGTVLAVTMVPPLCTVALKALGAQWVLGRFETVAFVLWIPLSVPVLAALLERFPPRAFVRDGAWRFVPGQVALSAVALLAVPIAQEHASQRKPYTIPIFIDAAMRTEGVRNGRQWAGLLKQKEWMDEAIPADAVVLSGPLTGTWVSMLHGASSVASERSSTGIASGRVRRVHVEEMFDPQTDEGRRAELFDGYGVTHVLTRGRAPTWARYWTNGANRKHGHVVLRLRPRPDESLLWMREIEIARAQLDRANPEGAAVRLSEVVGSHPESVDAWFTLGLARTALGDHAGALDCHMRAEVLEPDDPVHPLMHGNALASLGRFEEAIRSFERCAAVAEGESDVIAGSAARFNIGNALYELDRPEEALRAYERALELDPRHAKARTARAWLRQDLGIDPPDERAVEPPMAEDAPPAETAGEMDTAKDAMQDATEKNTSDAVPTAEPPASASP